MTKSPKHTNRLINELSPYLVQHAHNPVDWFPWGEEALKKAKKEMKPIFLSIGYSACHWCHVMERESFENEEIAEILNQHFISIKVDREEREDLDHIYMQAVQIMTQHGGWPMSVFLTPDLKPFYGGTYFPPEDRMGLPSFKKILIGVAGAWETKREALTDSANELLNTLKSLTPQTTATFPLSLDFLSTSFHTSFKHYDKLDGGIGNAPKFFHTMDLRVALRFWLETKHQPALDMVTHTLEAWARGGIYDQLGGGFHRYSTDAKWLAPHFEKMLYDNALVTQLYLEAFQITKSPLFARVAREVLDYIVREMSHPQGGYYSTQDADSEGIEGKFYVWSKKEVETYLEPELAKLFSEVFDVTEHGNWEHTNILRLTGDLSVLEAHEVQIAKAKRKLFEERNNRIKPFRDEKILCNWNGLMLEAMALGAQVFSDRTYLDSAIKTGEFIWGSLWDSKTKRLSHLAKDGSIKQKGFLDDYANTINGFIALYEATFDPKWIKRAKEIADSMNDAFWEASEKMFYYTERGATDLILRPKETYDGATPSATAVAVTALVKLGRIYSHDGYLKIAETVLTQFSEQLRTSPSGHAQYLLALCLLMQNPVDVVLSGPKEGENREAVLTEIYQAFLPNRVLLEVTPDWKNIHFEGRETTQSETTVYFCKQFTCEKSIKDIEELKNRLKNN